MSNHNNSSPALVPSAAVGDDLLADSGAGAGFEAVLAAVANGIASLAPPAELRRLTGAILRNPVPPARRLAELALRLGGLALSSGTASTAADALDRRFADPAWVENPYLNRLALAYLAYCDTILGTLDDVDVDWRTRERLRLLVDNVLAAQSPTNNLLVNPSSVKRLIDTGGGSLRAGLANLVRDLRTPSKLPASVDKSSFTLGVDLAATPGKVVRRSRLYELIEYEPVTESVDVVPVLIIASPVNKYYLLDLEPDESLIKAEVERGRRVFVASWVNPDEGHADAGFDAYVAGILEMLETVTEIAGTKQAHLLGMCGGGQLTLMTAAYLAALGRQHELATLTIGIAVVDYEPGPATMALLDRKAADKAIQRASERGYFDAADSARSFALIRPNDGIWGNVVNNYLLGRKPPAMGLLFWAVDQTNMTTRFGRDMIETALDNRLAKPGGIEILGVPIDTRQITVDTYVLAGSTDHISPWRDCYRTLAMLGGTPTFVLARGGHAVVVSRPPGGTRSSHRTGEVTGADSDQWLANSRENPGSWWDDWNHWIEQHTPDTRPAPGQPGNDAYPPLADAPGEYVMRVLA